MRWWCTPQSERTVSGNGAYTLSPDNASTWDLFINSQRHWRRSQLGHLEAWDACGFESCQRLLRRRVPRDQFEALLDMLDEQRHRTNEIVTEKARSAMQA